MRDPVIDEAVAVAGGPAAFAAALGIKAPSPYSWTRVPPLRVLAVEALTGIPRTRLRPDLYPPEEKPRPAARRRAA